MQRRKLLQGMLTLPIATALGCRHKNQNQPPANGRPGTLKIYLHGPFAVVLNAKHQYRIRAFVPFDGDGTEDRKHEFRFPTPKDVLSDEGDPGHRNRFEFTLRDDHLELSGKRPRIDAGFGVFQFHTGEWEPTSGDYFVSLDLPAPDVITFAPKAVVPVELENGNLAMLPLDHVLEYRVRDFRKINEVKLHVRPLNRDYNPQTCEYMLSMHSEAMRAAGSAGQPGGSVVPHLDSEFKQCAEPETAAFFLGVGLSPTTSIQVLRRHALEFFNKKILKAFPNSQEAKNIVLQAVDVKACGTSGSTTTTPTLLPAAQWYSVPEPHLRQVASFDDCRIGGVIGTTP